MKDIDAEHEARIDRELEAMSPASNPPGWGLGVAAGLEGMPGDNYDRSAPLPSSQPTPVAAESLRSPLGTRNLCFLLTEMEALLPLAESIDAARKRAADGRRDAGAGADLAEGLRQLIGSLTLDESGTPSLAPERGLLSARRDPKEDPLY